MYPQLHLGPVECESCGWQSVVSGEVSIADVSLTLLTSCWAPPAPSPPLYNTVLFLLAIYFFYSSNNTYNVLSVYFVPGTVLLFKALII